MPEPDSEYLHKEIREARTVSYVVQFIILLMLAILLLLDWMRQDTFEKVMDRQGATIDRLTTQQQPKGK